MDFCHTLRGDIFIFSEKVRKKTSLKKTCKLRESNVAISQKTNCCGKKKFRDNYFAFSHDKIDEKKQIIDYCHIVDEGENPLFLLTVLHNRFLEC